MNLFENKKNDLEHSHLIKELLQQKTINAKKIEHI